jgi:hypothetical protein
MIIAQLESVFRALNQSQTRYVLVGGLAVIAHGYLRTTSDIDLVIALSPENLRRALSALHLLGYIPKQTVKLEDFADPVKREQWILEKNMLVFQLTTNRPRELPIDIFVREPFDFDHEYANARRFELAPDINVPVATIKTLIKLKTTAGRPNDLDDLRRLKLLFPHEFE